MDDLNPTPDLDTSQLSAPDLQRLGVTVAQVRVVYASPAVVVEPDLTSAFPDMWQLLGLTNDGRFIFVALKHEDYTGNLQPSASQSPTTSLNSASFSAGARPNPFQGPGAEDAWRRLRAGNDRVVTREEMMRRIA